MNHDSIQTADGPSYGRSLQGLGLNLLVKDVQAQAAFLEAVFAMQAIRADSSSAVMAYGPQHFMLHVDGSYAGHPLLGVLPEFGVRGAGLELRLYDTDPDEALTRAQSFVERGQASVLRGSSDRPHGLRECYILDGNGYCWVPSMRLKS